jgi:hypothetical protein
LTKIAPVRKRLRHREELNRYIAPLMDERTTLQTTPGVLRQEFDAAAGGLKED